MQEHAGNLPRNVRRVLRCELENPSLSSPKLAALLKLSTSAVEKTRARLDYKEAREDIEAAMSQSAVEILTAARVKAAEVMVSLLDAKDPRVALKAAELILGDVLKQPAVVVEHEERHHPTKEELHKMSDLELEQVLIEALGKKPRSR